MLMYCHSTLLSSTGTSAGILFILLFHRTSFCSPMLINQANQIWWKGSGKDSWCSIRHTQAREWKIQTLQILGVQWSGACQTPFFLKTKDKYHNPLYVESRKKWYKWSLLPKQKETHRLRKQTQGSQGEEIVKDFGKVMYTLLYLKWITNKNLLYGTWSSAQCYVPAWVGEGFGGK